MVTALLGAHDLTVGTYTSPHLERINERISPQRRADRRRRAGRGAHRPGRPSRRSSSVEPSYFELLTAAAFRWFSDEAVAAAVVEVGLLGRWDATNVVDGLVAVLTNVGHDHTDGQGDWRRRIAEEKAGIVKPGATFVLGETDPGAAPTSSTARRRRRCGGATSTSRATRTELAVGGRLLDLRTPGARYDEVFLPLHGAHQGENAAVALAAAEAFFGRPLDPDVVCEAFAAVRNPGRFEVVQRDPLLILDGAHNRDGAHRGRARRSPRTSPSRASPHLVVGVLDGRDPAELLEILDAEARPTVVCCTPDSPRALPAPELAELVRRARRSARRGRPTSATRSSARSAVADARRRRARHRLALHRRRRARRVPRASGWSRTRVTRS